MLTITAPPRVFCRSSYWRERSNGALLIYECQVVAKYFSLEILDVLLISCDILRVRKKIEVKSLCFYHFLRLYVR